MNRPKQYDRDEVLEKATDLFWEKGFEATSMNEMVARANLNKHSLYSEFGDKEKLFIECIDHYIRRKIAYPISSKYPQKYPQCDWLLLDHFGS